MTTHLTSPMGYRPRSEQFCYVTWLAPYLSGENHCLLHLHQKINYQTPKSNADFSGWVEEHTRLVNEEHSRWAGLGGTVTIEDENFFKIRSKTGVTLSGKCDLVIGSDSTSTTTGIIVDVKTGRRKAKDRTQVMLYMALLPSVDDIPHIHDTPIGIVKYKDGSTIEVDAHEITPEFKRQTRTLLELTTQSTPEATPSFHECRFCSMNEECPFACNSEPSTNETDWL